MQIYANTLEKDFDAVASSSGRADRQLILFRRSRFELVLRLELDEFNNGTHRSPLLVLLEDRQTRRPLVIVGNHLARGNARLRQQQAIGLREWARAKPLAGIITIGDFNMDFSFKTMKGNPAFGEMIRDNVWKWVSPEPLVDTQWSDNNGRDRYPNSMLDFAFVSGPAKAWQPKCRVIVRPDDFPDNGSTSDHRPVELRIKVPAE